MSSRVLFDAAGLSGRVDMLSFRLRDALARLADGSIDALVWSGGLPTPAIADLDAELPLRILDIAALATPMSHVATGLVAAVVDVIATDAAHLVPPCVRGLQYLDTPSMIQTGHVPLHPGAVDTYRNLHG